MSSSDNSRNLLEVSGLKKLYRNGRGVKNMTFSLSRGDVFGLLGSNGSGKTTAIRSICGLCPYKGEIRLFGESVAENPRGALRRVGCIVEAPSFYAYLSAEQNLLLAARYYGMKKTEARQAAAWALGIVGLTAYRREKTERFSLGMKARLGLALCFISKPEFLALDEPLNGLDIEGMVEVRNIIMNMASIGANPASAYQVPAQSAVYPPNAVMPGAAFLISSHLAAEVEKTCNRVGVMDEGELLETAYMRDVLRDYGSVEAYYINVINRRRGIAGGFGYGFQGPGGYSYNAPGADGSGYNAPSNGGPGGDGGTGGNASPSGNGGPGDNASPSGNSGLSGSPGGVAGGGV